MYLHSKKEEFIDIINEIKMETNIPTDLLEKDYYVCLVLKELAKNQDYLKAYFKGGTAVYKILDTINRFSEDIDLTVEVIEGESKTSNKKRLEKSALGYQIESLELQKDKCDQRMSKSVTAFYKYQSLFKDANIPLHKAEEVQVEATSFTVSEPTEVCIVEPLIYKFATEQEKTILEKEFEIGRFEIITQKLERIFIDKLFASELYFEKGEYVNLAKHLYDITILMKQDRIRKLFDNKAEFNQIVGYKRKEEIQRYGGVEENLAIKDFGYFNMEFDEQFLKDFSYMQDKYIFMSEYKIRVDEVKRTLKKIQDKLS